MTEPTHPSRSFDPHGERIRFEQIDALYRNVAIGVLGALAAAALIAWTLVEVDNVPASVALEWLAGGCALVSYHLLLLRAYTGARRLDMDPRPWAYGFVAGAFAEGVWWSVALVVLAGPERVGEQYLVLLAAFTIANGAVPTFGSYLPAFYAIFFPITLTALGWNLAQGGALHVATALGCGVLIVTMFGLARIANANFNQTLRLRFEKDALAEELRSQKERAEEANLSKSRFLAAASHDLRQPIHALGMFVGALGRHEMNQDMRRLVGSIEDSIGAMDGLFSSLLDISKLDAGIVEPNLRPFAIGPLIQRICREYAGEALQKGISLEVCGCGLSVLSDPVLLERILRNIVSNAIRYTERGRVLVGCRRGGDRLRIQVWDTGRGIARSQFERVFEEFYQIGNPERDRDKGLGLGLAIVKRLTVLLDHPLTLQSKIGRGSVFTISVPVGAGGATPVASSAVDPSPRSLEGLVLVVDDEALVQDAMKSLLTSWGLDVIAAGSGDEMLERIASCLVAPDLILCDYRLRDGENGIDVIRRLQAEYNDDVPAVLITGDTASERLREARDSGFIVLNKPVANSKLRAALGNVMSRRQRAEAE
jgi:signal transduction histidine kinase/CheY-like chemotaxis protein